MLTVLNRDCNRAYHNPYYGLLPDSLLRSVTKRTSQVGSPLASLQWVGDVVNQQPWQQTSESTSGKRETSVLLEWRSGHGASRKI